MKSLYKALCAALLPFLSTPALAQLPQLDWHKTFYATGPGASVSFGQIQTSLDGNMVVFGTIDGVVDIDPGPGTQMMDKADGAAFFAKFDQRGNLLWARQLPVSVVAWDLNPETGWLGYAARFSDPYDFNPGSGSHVIMPVAGSLALVRLDADGNFKGADDVRLDAEVICLSLNNQGRVILAGNFFTPLRYDPLDRSKFLRPAGKNDGFVAIYSNELSLLQAFPIAGTDQDRINTLVGTADGFTVGGSFTNTTNFSADASPETLTASGTAGFFASYALDQAGASLTGVTRLGASVEKISIDPRSSSMTFYGSVGDSMDADPGPGVSMIYAFGWADEFISHIRRDGSFGFGRSIGTGLVRPQSRLSASQHGDVFYGGSMSQPLDLDNQQSSGMLNPNGITDMFISKFHEDGTLRYAFNLGVSARTTRATVAAAANGAILVGGLTNATLDLDPGAGTVTINPDLLQAAFLARYKDENTLGIAPVQASEIVRIHGSHRAAIVDFSACTRVDASITVTDISGRCLMRTTHRSSDMLRLDLSQLPSGIVLVTVQNGTSKISGKIPVHD